MQDDILLLKAICSENLLNIHWSQLQTEPLKWKFKFEINFKITFVSALTIGYSKHITKLINLYNKLALLLCLHS